MKKQNVLRIVVSAIDDLSNVIKKIEEIKKNHPKLFQQIEVVVRNGF